MDKYSKVRKANHIKALQSLGFKAGAFNTLRAIENEANRNAVLYCNGDIDGPQYEARKWNTIARVSGLQHGNLPAGFFVNGDPRGYALKIESDNLPEGIHKDWGGYGILAPEF
jgi:hypothetical protein